MTPPPRSSASSVPPTGNAYSNARAPSRSGDQKQFANGVAATDVAVCGRGVVETVLLVDVHLELAARDPTKNLVRTTNEAWPRADVVGAAMVADIDRTQAARRPLERRGGARALAVGQQVSSRGKATQAFPAYVAADRVEHRIDALAAGVLPDLVLEIAARIDDDLVGTEGADEGGFLVRRHGCVDIGAEHLRHLNEVGADAASGGVDQDAIAGRGVARVVQQVVRGLALVQDCDRKLEVEAVGQRHQLVCRDDGLFLVGTEPVLAG